MIQRSEAGMVPPRLFPVAGLRSMGQPDIPLLGVHILCSRPFSKTGGQLAELANADTAFKSATLSLWLGFQLDEREGVSAD